MRYSEMKEFVAWLKDNNEEYCTISEAAVLLSHWRDGKESGLYV